MFVDATGAESALLCFVAIRSDDDRFNKFAVYISRTDIAVNKEQQQVHPHIAYHVQVSGMEQGEKRQRQLSFFNMSLFEFYDRGFGFQARDGSRERERVYASILHT